MNRIAETLSHFTVASLLVLAAGCAGPDEAEDPEAVPSFSEPAEPEPEPAPEATETAQTEPAQTEEPEVATYEPAESYEAEEDDDSFDFTVLALFGQRQLEEDDWAPADKPFSSNLNFMARTPARWLHWDVTVGFGDDKGTALIEEGSEELLDMEVKIWEVDLGLVTIWHAGILRPYVGVGAAIVNVDAEVSTEEGFFGEDDTTVGGYGRAGLMFEVTDGGLVGFDVRYLVGTDVSIAGVDVDVDGFQGLVSIGWSW